MCAVYTVWSLQASPSHSYHGIRSTVSPIEHTHTYVVNAYVHACYLKYLLTHWKTEEELVCWMEGRKKDRKKEFHQAVILAQKKPL